ncbi:curli production assembly/transport component CsgF [Lutibacter sp.]|uniref:curli production assembly/transport component CsgF n=1 Tax=Lutibacter sp. TaxID=1925666 RepID=UPI0025C4CAB0|nr:curli production assembly/transport component CsgF [Lutibacter sp.]MCF6168583.1 curli assembly protein CsgF [Lutibacter sp.]
MKKLQKIFTIIIFLVPYILFSQNLVYKPINPFFGGDTFNYQQLLAAANAQNDFEEDNGFNFSQPTDLENFTESLNRQLLNSISQDLFRQQFGDQALTVGTFVFGSLVVDVSPSSGGLLINILDTSTGEQTQITIPN